MQYNLCDENWIPVLYRNGEFKRVSILTALHEAGRISQIATSNPMDRVALLRFLLAIVYWCQGNPSSPEQVNELIQANRFPDDWFGKLCDQKNCFDLFDTEKRFYQDISTQRERPITDLIHEVPTANNFWHFNHSIDYQGGLCPACCAAGLLRLPLFYVSGLPDMKTGINGTPPIYVIPFGRTLLQTLCLNWQERNSELGIPAWENPTIRPKSDFPVPLLTGMTVLSRRIKLHEPVSLEGRCLVCGNLSKSLIKTCEFQSAGSLENDQWKDPHVVCSSSDKSIKAPNLEDELISDRPWCYLFTNYELQNNQCQNLFITGFSTNKAKYVDVWERTCTLPEKQIGKGLDWKEIGERVRRLRPYESGNKETKNRRYQGLHASIATACPHVESKISQRISELLSVDDETVLQNGLNEYRDIVTLIAASQYPAGSIQSLRQKNLLLQAVNAIPLHKPQSSDKKRKKA